jgi:hypothetical protein
MPYHLSRTEQYRQKIDECIAMAKASTSNKVRAHHYKTAAHYLHLLESTLPVTKRLGLSRANSSAIRGSRSKSGVLGAVFDFDQTHRAKGGRVVCAIVE